MTVPCRSLRFCTFSIDVDHPLRCVLCTVLRSFCTCPSERCTLAAAINAALTLEDVGHPVWYVLCTVLRQSCVGQSKIRSQAALGCALSVLDVLYPGRGVLYAVVRDFPALSSRNRNFAKALSSARFAAGEVDRPACYVLPPAALPCSITIWRLPYRDIS